MAWDKKKLRYIKVAKARGLSKVLANLPYPIELLEVLIIKNLNADYSQR